MEYSLVKSESAHIFGNTNLPPYNKVPMPAAKFGTNPPFNPAACKACEKVVPSICTAEFPPVAAPNTYLNSLT